MTNAEVLIELVRSLSKNEKRSFRLGKKSTADYIVLFDLIDKDGLTSVEELKTAFEKIEKSAVFNVTVSYLYKLLLDKLLALRQNADVDYSLMAQILKAKILFEKSIFPAALDILSKVKQEAKELERNEALMMASRLELDYLQHLNMPGISEEELINKHFSLTNSLDALRSLYEQSFLYELLMHRTIYKGAIRSSMQKDSFNDLVYKEYNLARKASRSFEAQKRHLLFQSGFLMAVGDEQSASDVLVQLKDLIADNPGKDNSLFYVAVLENMLENMRETGRYEQMPALIERLQSISHPSHMVKMHIDALVGLYNLLPMLDHGEFRRAKDFIEKCEALQPAAIEKLNPSMESKVSLYCALVNIGLRDYKKARKALVRPIMNKTCDLPIHRILRITALIIHHKMNDVDYIYSETRSMKREMAKSGKAYRMENLILEVVAKGSYALMSTRKREQIWDKIKPRLDDIRQDVFEAQLLKIFDFSAWIEAEVLRTSFSETLCHNCLNRSSVAQPHNDRE